MLVVESIHNCDEGSTFYTKSHWMLLLYVHVFLHTDIGLRSLFNLNLWKYTPTTGGHMGKHHHGPEAGPSREKTWTRGFIVVSVRRRRGSS